VLNETLALSRTILTSNPSITRLPASSRQPSQHFLRSLSKRLDACMHLACIRRDEGRHWERDTRPNLFLPRTPSKLLVWGFRRSSRHGDDGRRRRGCREQGRRSSSGQQERRTTLGSDRRIGIRSDNNLGSLSKLRRKGLTLRRRQDQQGSGKAITK
jgi:hypothetical protein